MTNTPNNKSIEDFLDEWFDESHTDADYMTCNSLYLVSPKKRQRVYIYNATSAQRKTYLVQKCNCGVEDNRIYAEAQLIQLIEQARLDAGISELENYPVNEDEQGIPLDQHGYFYRADRLAELKKRKEQT